MQTINNSQFLPQVDFSNALDKTIRSNNLPSSQNPLVKDSSQKSPAHLSHFSNPNIQKLLQKLNVNSTQGGYGSAQERTANWLVRLAAGDASVLNESLKSTLASFNESNTDGFQNLLMQSSGTASGFNLDDTYNVALSNDFKSQVSFSNRKFLDNFLQLLRQGPQGISSMLQSQFGMSTEEADQLGPDILAAINEKFPDLIFRLTQDSARMQAREDGFAQNVSMSKSLKQTNDSKLNEIIKLGSNGGN